MIWNVLKSRDHFLRSSITDGNDIIAALGRSQAIIEFKVDGTILTANDTFLKAVGYSLGEIVGEHHRIFVDPVDRESGDYATFWERLRSGAFISAEFRRVGKGGRDVWLQATYNPILDGSGAVQKIIKFATVVTGAKLASADMAGQIAAIGKSQAVIAFALDGTILSVNDNFLRSVGYAMEEVVGRHHSMFVAPAEREGAAYKALWADLNRGQHLAGEFKRIAKGGREIWLQASYNPILDLSGRPFKVVKYAMDVTATKLHAADVSGQIAAISQSQAVIAFALDGTILSANDRFLATMGYGLDEVVGQHHGRFMPAEERNSQHYRDFWAALNRGEYRSGEFRRVAKDGRAVWLQASYNPIRDLNGVPFKVVKYAVDISDEVAQREKFNLLSLVADGTDNSVVITDRHRRIIYVNGGFERMTGYRPDEVMGQNPGKLLQGPRTDPATVSRMRSALAKGEPFYDEILNYDRKKNSYWISLAINPIRGQDGAIDRYISIQANVSTTKRSSLEFHTKLAAIGASTAMAEWDVGGAPMSANAILSGHRPFDVSLRSVLGEDGQQSLMRGGSCRREISWPSASGAPLWLDAVFSVLNDFDEKPYKILMCGVDVTARKSTIETSTRTMGDIIDRITGMMDALNGFARQTNLLALNAAIEASRAHEAGRGFAVVAQEIRKLAVQAAESMSQIDALLSESRGQVEAMSSSGQAPAEVAETQRAA